MAAGGAAPLRGGEVAGAEAGPGPGGSGVTRIGQRGRGCYGELNGGEKATNPRAERGERWGQSLGRIEGALARHSDHGEGS
jgi:hypothetical protein